jgi:hypothetical protein
MYQFTRPIVFPHFVRSFNPIEVHTFSAFLPEIREVEALSMDRHGKMVRFDGW